MSTTNKKLRKERTSGDDSSRMLNMRDCYGLLKDLDVEADISWLCRLPMATLSGSARACMFAICEAKRQKPSRALSFMVLADGLADDRERACVLLLRSIFESLCGDAEAAMRIAREAEEVSQAQGDKEIERDVIEHLALLEKEVTQCK